MMSSEKSMDANASLMTTHKIGVICCPHQRRSERCKVKGRGLFQFCNFDGWKQWMFISHRQDELVVLPLATAVESEKTGRLHRAVTNLNSREAQGGSNG
jgi:hypothetical protein